MFHQIKSKEFHLKTFFFLLTFALTHDQLLVTEMVREIFDTLRFMIA